MRCRTFCPPGRAPRIQKMKMQAAKQMPPSALCRMALSTPKSNSGYRPKNFDNWMINQMSNLVGIRVTWGMNVRCTQSQTL